MKYRTKNIISFSLFIFVIIFFLGFTIDNNKYFAYASVTCKECLNDMCYTYTYPNETTCPNPHCKDSSECREGTFYSKMCLEGKCSTQKFNYYREDSCEDHHQCESNITYWYKDCLNKVCTNFTSNYDQWDRCQNDEECEDYVEWGDKKYCHSALSTDSTGTVVYVWSCVMMDPADAVGYETCSTVDSCIGSSGTTTTPNGGSATYSGSYYCDKDTWSCYWSTGSTPGYSTRSECLNKCKPGSGQCSALRCGYDHGSPTEEDICGRRYFSADQCPRSDTCQTDADCIDFLVPDPFNFSLSTSGDITVTRPFWGPSERVHNRVTATLINPDPVSKDSKSVIFSQQGLPSGVEEFPYDYLSSYSCTPTCYKINRLWVSSDAPLGTFPITVTGTAEDGLERTTTYNLIILDHTDDNDLNDTDPITDPTDPTTDPTDPTDPTADPTDPTTPPLCKIHNFELPKRAWVNIETVAKWSTNDVCTRAEINCISDDCSDEVENLSGPVEVGFNRSKDFTIRAPGTYRYEMEACGPNNNCDTYIDEVGLGGTGYPYIEIEALYLPWWQEIIPQSLQGFLRGLWEWN
jgi:hypothetical protein